MSDTFFGHVIDGEEVPSQDGAVLDVWNPWTQEVYGQAAEGGKADAARAVASSRRAFDEGPWPRLGRAARAAAIHRLADVMEAHADELAAADTTDMGKPLAQARHDVARSIWNFRFFSTTSVTTAARSTRWTPATTPTASTAPPVSSRRSAPGTFR